MKDIVGKFIANLVLLCLLTFCIFGSGAGFYVLYLIISGNSILKLIFSISAGVSLIFLLYNIIIGYIKGRK